jgi:hypothetical protein
VGILLWHNSVFERVSVRVFVVQCSIVAMCDHHLVGAYSISGGLCCGSRGLCTWCFYWVTKLVVSTV